MKVENLTKKFGKKTVLNTITFEVPTGEIVGLIGENGVGKTTLIRCMMNIETNYSGSVTFAGQTNTQPEIFKKVTLLHDNQVLYPQLTAYDHLMFLKNIYQLPNERIQEVVEIVGIENYLHKKSGEYSLGMKQHLLIAMALMNHAEYIIMDEPFNGLDPTSVLELKQIIRNLQSQNVTILLSSHNLALIQDLTSKVYLLKNAELNPIALDETQYQVYTLVVQNNTDISEILKRLGVVFVQDEHKWQIQGDITSVLNELMKQQIALETIQQHQVSLEEIYQNLYLT